MDEVLRQALVLADPDTFFKAEAGRDRLRRSKRRARTELVR